MRSAAAAAGAEHTGFEREANEIGTGAEAELVRDARAIGLDRLHAEPERFCDLALRLAARQALEDLALARAEERERVAALLRQLRHRLRRLIDRVRRALLGELQASRADVELVARHELDRAEYALAVHAHAVAASVVRD